MACGDRAGQARSSRAARAAGGRVPIRNSNTGGGSRTHTGVSAQRILSPQRLPFRHAGSCGEVSTGRRCHKRKEPGRPGRFAIGAGPIRSRSDRSGGTPIHDQHGPHHRYRGIPLQRPIYLADQRPATDPRGSVRGSSRRRHPLFLEVAAIIPQSLGQQGGAVHSRRSRHCATKFHNLRRADFGLRNHSSAHNLGLELNAAVIMFDRPSPAPRLWCRQETGRRCHFLDDIAAGNFANEESL